MALEPMSWGTQSSLFTSTPCLFTFLHASKLVCFSEHFGNPIFSYYRLSWDRLPWNDATQHFVHWRRPSMTSSLATHSVSSWSYLFGQLLLSALYSKEGIVTLIAKPASEYLAKQCPTGVYARQRPDHFRLPLTPLESYPIGTLSQHHSREHNFGYHENTKEYWSLYVLHLEPEGSRQEGFSNPPLRRQRGCVIIIHRSTSCW